jgi:hypothetical protein
VNYLVDPINLPPKSGTFTTATVGPYVCTGTVELPRVIDQNLNLSSSSFPIGDFINHLNSRFNTFNTTTKECSAIAAPPDSNIRSFAGANINWMTNPARKVADPAPTTNRMETIADLDPASGSATGPSYGPLWVYARAVPWSAYTPGKREPAQGYTPFQATPAIWQTLYPPGPSLGTYPTDANNSQSSPYFATQTLGTPPTNYPGVMFRRVLNIPLLSCPAGSPPGKVVAIGRFFMTMPADGNGIYAEFAGVTLQDEPAGPVELY